MPRQNLSAELPPAAAIAEGATTPDPGGSAAHGVRLYSTTLSRMVEWTGTFWKSVPLVTTGTTAPSNPRVGDVWIDTN